MWTHSAEAIKNAQWFLQLLKLLPNIEGVNIRMLHYLGLDKGGLVKPDGYVYQNTIDDFKFLNTAYEQACYYSLIPYSLFDNCNTASYVKLSCRQREHLLKLMFDNLCKDYSYWAAWESLDFHVEIWLENSYSGSLILPVAKKYNVNFVAAQQALFVGTLFQFVRRIVSIDKPVRVLYLSDFDGQNRFEETKEKLDMLLKKYRVEPDVGFECLMLKECQCGYLNLPVMYDSDRVELSAMEVKYPGIIRRVLEEYMCKYIDYESVNKYMIQSRRDFSKLLPEVNKLFMEF